MSKYLTNQPLYRYYIFCNDSKMQPNTDNILKSSTQQTYLISQQYSHYIIITSDSPICVQSQQPRELYLQFVIKPLESIRVQKPKTVLRLSLGNVDFQLFVDKQKREYVFQEGRYRNYVFIKQTYKGKSTTSGFKQIREGEQTKITVTIEDSILRDQQSQNKQMWIAPTLILGHQSATMVFKCKIRALTFGYQTSKEDIKTMCLSDRQLEEGPLNSLPDCQSLPQIQSLPKYQSPKVDRLKNRLYLCHDMKGGYIQDTNTNKAYPDYYNKQNSHSYRTLHLPQCEIFNYFSHHLISVPPLHWRRLCRKSGTLCLGTFIVQSANPSDQEYLSQQTIRLLVYLCRQYQFDGYLINIEYKVKDVSRLVSWLEQLTQLIHQLIPRSLIIWYDSVIESGLVNYQNQLNHANSMFYWACDGIFLNYWWNEESLKRSIVCQQQQQQSKSQKKNSGNKDQIRRIYVGSDCFGRGTFGGGEFNTYKAVNTINSILNSVENANIRTALFAMGYTYEGEPETNRQLWKMNEKSMHRGIHSKTLKISKNQWLYSNPQVNGCKWHFQGQWAVTSFNNCKRTSRYRLKQFLPEGKTPKIMVIKMGVTVMGTGPNWKDPFCLTIQVKQNNYLVNSSSTGKKVCSQKQQSVYVSLDLDCGLINEGTWVEIIEEGQDAQHWGGHFGSRFKSECLYMMTYSKQRDWSAVHYNGSIKPLDLSSVHLTHYNMGHGPSFYYCGHKIAAIKNRYDYLSDMDMNYAYLLNHPYNVSICYDDAFMGGSCLKVELSRSINKLRLMDVFGLKSSSQYRVQLVLKVPPKFLYEKAKIIFKEVSSEQSRSECKMEKIDKLENSWISLKYDIEFDMGIDQASIYLDMGGNIDNQSIGGDILIGKLLVAHSLQKQNLRKQEQLDEENNKALLQNVSLKLSQNNPPISPLCVDLAVTTIRSTRLLVLIKTHEPHSTPIYASYLWSDSLNNHQSFIKDIPTFCTKAGYSNVFRLQLLREIASVSQQVDYKVLKEWPISLSELIQKGQLKLI